MRNVSFSLMTPDDRPAVVLDDVDGATFAGFSASTSPGVPTFVQVTNTRKRDAGFEYVKDRPYRRTTVTKLAVPSRMGVVEVTVDRPAPGTPPDSLYAHPTAPSEAHPFAYPVSDADYPKPQTIYPHIGAPTKVVVPKGALQ